MAKPGRSVASEGRRSRMRSTSAEGATFEGCQIDGRGVERQAEVATAAAAAAAEAERRVPVHEERQPGERRRRCCRRWPGRMVRPDLR